MIQRIYGKLCTDNKIVKNSPSQRLDIVLLCCVDVVNSASPASLGDHRCLA